MSTLFYLELLWTRSQSGFLAFWVGNIIFLFMLSYVFMKGKLRLKALLDEKLFKYAIIINVLFLLITFFIGIPVGFLSKYTLSDMLKATNHSQSQQTSLEKPPTQELGGSDSGKIRLIVWQGAIEAFKQNPLTGSGVETFAFAYYKVKPLAHNLTSEWDYLYNKAHNEYLNYLATTGIFGLGTYLAHQANGSSQLRQVQEALYSTR
jgi:O-antigen ligase